MNNKISEKDKKNWEDFLSNDEKLPNKDAFEFEKKAEKTRSLDLHGKALDEANYYKEKRERLNILLNNLIRIKFVN